jgi:hypothetical protein
MTDPIPLGNDETVTIDEACAILNVSKEKLREVMEAVKNAEPIPYVSEWELLYSEPRWPPPSAERLRELRAVLDKGVGPYPVADWEKPRLKS